MKPLASWKSWDCRESWDDDCICFEICRWRGIWGIDRPYPCVRSCALLSETDNASRASRFCMFGRPFFLNMSFTFFPAGGVWLLSWGIAINNKWQEINDVKNIWRNLVAVAYDGYNQEVVGILTTCWSMWIFMVKRVLKSCPQTPHGMSRSLWTFLLWNSIRFLVAYLVRE